MIQVSGLRKQYGKAIALRGVSFEVNAGEIVGLLGRNGAGKTTTLHCLAGISRFDAGSIRIADVDLAAQPVDAKRKLAFIPDEPEFFDYMTAEEHIEFFRRLYSSEPSQDADPLQNFGLSEKRSAFPHELSRGMRQKLALACHLWRSPNVILLDEPLTGLDPIGMREVKDVMLARAEAGAAILLSSHLLHLVRETCSRVVVIDQGSIVAERTLESGGVQAPDELEALFAPSAGAPA